MDTPLHPNALTTPLLDFLVPHLPDEFAPLECLNTSSRAEVEILLRFVLGGDCPLFATREMGRVWIKKQPDAMRAVQDFVRSDSKTLKRTCDHEDADTQQGSKRPRTDQPQEDENDPPLFTLPAISTTSPVRKKADITVHTRSIRFVNPTSRALEASVPLSSIARAFLLPTRGKAKEHWTVVLLCSDSPPDKGKGGGGQANCHQQIIFGVDAVSATEFETTSYSFFTKANGQVAPSSRSLTTTKETVAKGTETRSSLCKLLSFLAVPLLEPTATVFRSACASSKAGDSAAGIDAYLSAKAGTLWFLDSGILWGESKPCEFWAVQDLVKRDGIRLLSATGRTCSVIIRRRQRSANEESSGGDDNEQEEFSETVFTMVEGKEQDPIHAWVRNRKHLFGNTSTSTPNSAPTSPSRGATASHKNLIEGNSVNGPEWDDSDSDDEDFATESEVVTSDSDSSDDCDDNQSSASQDGDESEDVDNGDDDKDEDEEELSETHHPLMRPGAMPRMSKAAVDAVIDLVNDEFGNGGSSEEDELEED